jgi:hypothetical protein
VVADFYRKGGNRFVLLLRARFMASGTIAQAIAPSSGGIGRRLKTAMAALKKPSRANTAITDSKRL